MQHPDEGTVHAWLDDQLPPEERAALEQHFDQCEQCAALVVDARGLVAGATRIVGALDGVRSGVVPPKKAAALNSPESLWRTLRLTPVRAAIAATLLLATGTIFTVRQAGRQTQNAASPAVGAAAPTASSVPTAAPALAAAPAVGPRTAASSRPDAKHTDRALAVDSTSAMGDRRRAQVVAADAGSAPRDTTQRAATPVSRAEPLRSSVADSISADARRDVAANARPAVRADSMAAMRMESKEAPAPQLPASSPRRTFSGGVIQLSEVVATGMVQTTDPRAYGCYRVDSAPFTSLRQFGISAPDSSGVPVVRSLTSSGRPDSVIPGARWRALAGDSVAVTAPSGSQSATLVFAVAGDGGSAAGRLTANGHTMPVQVLRTRCP